MCGIVGFRSLLHYKKLEPYLFEATMRLNHRGPDDEGYHFDKDSGTGLSHKRLSIIDLSKAGKQPMASDDGKIMIVYNGEIYNFLEIRKELIGCGYKFKSATDTEVILKAYQNWGIECLNRLIGMFALSIWDKRKNHLFLARDRLGIKPLYYYFDGDSFIFASELKSIMAFKETNLQLNKNAIPLFLHYQYIPAPNTVFNNCWKLMPGNFLIYDGDTIKIKSYWNISKVALREDTDDNINEYDACDTLDKLITKAVSDRLISDVPLGALLSGGIDSSLVVAIMQKLISVPVKTFSIGFKEKNYDEAPNAANVARYLKTDHTELYLSHNDALDIVPKLPDIYDEPFADSSGLPTLLVCQLAKQKLTVALSGDGGDEQFAGYSRYWYTKMIKDRIKIFPDPFRKIIAKVFNKIPIPWIANCYNPIKEILPTLFNVSNFEDKLKKFILQINQNDLSEYYRMSICIWTKDEIKELINVSMPESHFDEIWHNYNNVSEISRMMLIDQGTYLPDCMLTKVDRASMAFGLEVRVPLLDHRIVEFSRKLPENLLFRSGSGKYILKQILSRYLPAELFNRPKMGFGVPIHSWIKGPLKPLVLDFLSFDSIKKEGLFEPIIVEKTLKEHFTNKWNHQHKIWALLMWQMWYKRWYAN